MTRDGIRIEQVMEITIDDFEQLLALGLPFEVRNPGLLGNDLQFATRVVALRLESASIAV